MEAADTGAWLRIVATLAEQRERIVDDFLDELGRTSRYDRYGISDADLRTSAVDAVDMLVAQLAGDPLPSRLRDVPSRLGVRRARQGVDRDDLLEAVRLDFRVIWAGLVRAAGADGDAILVHHALHVLGIVEQYIHGVHVAYLDERSSLATDSRLDETRAMSALFGATDVERAATSVQHRLRFRPQQPLEVYCARHDDAAALRAALASQRRHVVSWELEDSTACIREDVGDEPPAALAAVPCGLVRGIERLALVPQAVELSQRIVRLLGDGDGPTTQQGCWPALVRGELRAALPAAVPREVDALLELQEHERDRLLETVETYWSTGSIKSTAERLFVHRNTIVNRLNAFERLTGLAPTVPAQAARAIVALGSRVSA